MKKIKIFLIGSVLALGSYSVALACGVTECGGGETKCCTKEGSTYYMTRSIEITE
ncbi:hypothetical protein GCM10011506_37480 [Marivirga lumbricoides]|uniref:Membrane or secreted protein n=1 Tax=Marivirga lumbricoides TaxID=1046115 RepID=A0ABQ1MY01_9BACT|nr:hypothetical protein GCM10011506_37480 [Marivirga lumbricoides]